MHSNLAHGDACWVLLSFMQWWSCTDQQNQPRNGTKASTEQILWCRYRKKTRNTTLLALWKVTVFSSCGVSQRIMVI